MWCMGVSYLLSPSLLNHLSYKSISELSSSALWVEQGYHKNFKPYTIFTDSVERISVDKTSAEEFIEHFEKPYKPVWSHSYSSCSPVKQSFSFHLGCHPWRSKELDGKLQMDNSGKFFD